MGPLQRRKQRELSLNTQCKRELLRMARYAKRELPRFLKNVSFELARDFGVYGVFITCGTPETGEPPKV